MRDSIWLGDRLGRREDAEFLIDFLKARTAERQDAQGAYVLNLSAVWGEGKTFFLQKLREDLELTGHLVSYIDAWKDDDAGTPLVAVMTAMEATLKPHLAKKAALQKTWEVAKAATGKALVLTAKGAAHQLAKKAIGPAVEALGDLGVEVEEQILEDAILEDASNAVSEVASRYLKQRMDAYTEHQKATETFKARVAQLLKQLFEEGGKARPYFILIDELDRCRPTYAVEMLEQVKHLFDVPGLCFIIATDGEQLAHSVSAIYGQSFDGAAYLRRFFHRKYRFRQPDMQAYVEFLMETEPLPDRPMMTAASTKSADFIATCFTAYNLSLRDAAQIYDILRSFLTAWALKSAVQLAYLLPLICVHHLGRTDDYLSLARGDVTGVPGTWIVESAEWDVRERGTVMKARSVRHFMSNLAGIFTRSIDTYLIDNRPETQRDTWMGSALHDEMDKRFRGQLRRGDDPARRSLMAQYPVMLANVSRLSRDPE